MTLAALLALAMFAQDATGAAPQVADAASPAAKAAGAATVEGPVPDGAPADDYGLVSWCSGALSGHMALYDQVKPELDGLSKDPDRDTIDAEQMAAGRDYLALYERALAAAETANPRVRTAGEAARRKGAAMWTPVVNAVDPRARMWSWLGWSLPGRCETAAVRLAERSALFAPATATDATVETPTEP